jgi:copper transport protein
MTARRVASLVAAFLALAMALAPAPPARAHASLVRAAPADGAVMPLAPATLTLIFNEPVSPLVIRLIGPDGEPIAPRAVVAENATLTIVPPETLRRGTHVLSWRVTSADGHPVGGAVIFSIGAPSARSAAGAESVADRGVRVALWAARVAIYVGLFVGVGGAFFRAWFAGSLSPPAAPSIVALLAMGLVAVPLSVGLQGLDALELPLSGLQQKAAWETGLKTAYGLTAIAAAFTLIAGLFGVAAKSPRAARSLSLAGLLGTGLALALSGHASTAEPRLVSRAAVLLHGVGVAFWVGSLLPLYAAVRAAAVRDRRSAGMQLERFSRAIVSALVVLVASGVWLAWVQLGRIDALWTTSYGQVLACKLVCVAGLLGLAAANRYRLVGKFETGGAAAARTLAASIALELAIALMILGLVALWRFTPPPRSLAAAAAISLHVHGEKAMAEIEIEREGGQGARASLLVLDGAFRPFAVKEVTLVLANPAVGIEPLRRVATRTGENSWRIDDLRIPVAGLWNLRVEILIGEFEKVTIKDTVALPRMP